MATSCGCDCAIWIRMIRVRDVGRRAHRAGVERRVVPRTTTMGGMRQREAIDE